MITEFEFKLKDMPTNKPDAISVFIFFYPFDIQDQCTSFSHWFSVSALKCVTGIKYTLWGTWVLWT